MIELIERSKTRLKSVAEIRPLRETLKQRPAQKLDAGELALQPELRAQDVVVKPHEHPKDYIAHTNKHTHPASRRVPLPEFTRSSYITPRDSFLTTTGRRPH